MLLFFLFFIIPIWILLGPVIEIKIVSNITEEVDTCPVYAPSVLYENTKMNWFGCWFCFIFIRLLTPLSTLCLLLIAIFYFIYTFFKWLFTVGRKDEE